MKTIGSASWAHRAAAWWRGMQPLLSNGDRNPNADRAALAGLRRADLLAAIRDPATLDLFRKLGFSHPARLPDAGLVAAVLACIRADHSEHPARRLGIAVNDPDARPRLSKLRFQRLIQANDADERLTLFRRAVALAGNEIQVTEVAAALLDWSEERQRRWIFEYYGAGVAAPQATVDADSAANQGPPS